MNSPKRSKSPTYSILIPSSNESSPEKPMYQKYSQEFKPNCFAISNGTTTSVSTADQDSTTMKLATEVEKLKYRVAELEASNLRAIREIVMLKEQMANICSKMDSL